MAAERWQQLEVLFTAAAAEPPDRRAAVLARMSGDDASLREEASSLLGALDRSGDFLALPALELFARQISREGWAVQPGDRIGVYIVECRIGAGGMGEVWRGRDERLDRAVAIKLLLPHSSGADERMQAFEREARAAGSLNHPGVLTVYDVGDHGGAPYLVTECLDGESLRARIAAGPVPVDTALDIAIQTARGVAAAHSRGIVHRDLKPENIFLTPDGRVKVLDFGLAAWHDAPGGAASRQDTGCALENLLLSGTAGYMAPEQTRGESADPRTDVYALGIVLHELLTGRRPEVGSLHHGIAPDVASVLERCLTLAPAGRFASMDALAAALTSVLRARTLPFAGVRAFVRRPAVLATIATFVIAIAGAGWWWQSVQARTRWALQIAAPEIQRLTNDGEYAAAFILAQQALVAAPGNPHLQQLWLDASVLGSYTTEPAGATVEFSEYRGRRGAWQPLGTTPIAGRRVPRGLVRVRVSKPGYQTIEASAAPPGARFRLDPVADAPAGMVRVVGGRDERFGDAGDVDDFWIDRFEVTNRQFKTFVDEGGYERQDYWREPFIESGREVRWAAAVARFRDASGRPGPATWTAGTYPEGEADFPVHGVSWYEAAAYAAYAGKSLPTLYHWYRAAALGRFSDILAMSNFGEAGPAAVGTHQGIGPFGTYDMAGNVKEWCANDTGGRRFLLGGSWGEPRYMFADYDARPPFERAPRSGFRLARYSSPPRAALTDSVPVSTLARDARLETPVSDEIFEVYRRQYAYDHTPLNAVIESNREVESSVQQTIAMDAAYDSNRLRLHLFLPKKGRPPYQTVLFFPAGDAFVLRSSADMSLGAVEMIVRGGRAVLYPVYKGTYERGGRATAGPAGERELGIAWFRDAGRALDYAATRTDLDLGKLAFYGVSAGGDAGVILTALDPRFKVSVLQATGIAFRAPAEIDLLNFAPRVRVPTLLLTGRYDFEAPYETAQKPLFDLLGTPAEHKNHVAFETGHALSLSEVASQLLPWLDRYLGAVQR